MEFNLRIENNKFELQIHIDKKIVLLLVTTLLL